MESLLKWQHPFSTFIGIHNDLQLEEIKMISRLGSSNTTLVVTAADVGHTPSTSAGSSIPHAPAPMAPPAAPKSNKKKASKNNWNVVPTIANLWNSTLQL
jgi:hypothetical protein